MAVNPGIHRRLYCRSVNRTNHGHNGILFRRKRTIEPPFKKVVIASERRNIRNTIVVERRTLTNVVKRISVIVSEGGFFRSKDSEINWIKPVSITDSRVENFESVYRTLGIAIVVMRRRRLRDVSWREREFEGRGMRKVIDLNVTLRGRKRLGLLSFVDETNIESAG